MDFSLIIGLVLGLGMIITGFLMEDGVIASLLQISPVLIVIGGTIGAVVSSFAFSDIVKAFKAFMHSFSKTAKGNPDMVIKKLCEISDKCRKEGILSLESSLDDPELKKDEYLFMKEGLILILDGKSEEELEATLDSDIKAFSVHKQLEIAVFESAGGYSPTMGVLGTVMALVTVLANMGDDPAALAHSIATAFIATLYGVGLANVLWLPIANKMKTDLKRQKLQREMILDGVCMIARGEPSRNVENRLSLYWQAFPKGAKKYKAGIEN